MYWKNRNRRKAILIYGKAHFVMGDKEQWKLKNGFIHQKIIIIKTYTPNVGAPNLILKC